jgi:hypothetical protein
MGKALLLNRTTQNNKTVHRDGRPLLGITETGPVFVEDVTPRATGPCFKFASHFKSNLPIRRFVQVNQLLRASASSYTESPPGRRRLGQGHARWLVPVARALLLHLCFATPPRARRHGDRNGRRQDGRGLKARRFNSQSRALGPAPAGPGHCQWQPEGGSAIACVRSRSASCDPAPQSTHPAPPGGGPGPGAAAGGVFNVTA